MAGAPHIWPLMPMLLGAVALNAAANGSAGCAGCWYRDARAFFMKSTFWSCEFAGCCCWGGMCACAAGCAGADGAKTSVSPAPPGAICMLLNCCVTAATCGCGAPCCGNAAQSLEGAAAAGAATVGWLSARSKRSTVGAGLGAAGAGTGFRTCSAGRSSRRRSSRRSSPRRRSSSRGSRRRSSSRSRRRRSSGLALRSLPPPPALASGLRPCASSSLGDSWPRLHHSFFSYFCLIQEARFSRVLPSVSFPPRSSRS
mmetsp:Transcript_26161/g.77996  ORF Transcript_26161/g.77996 Transcript_26161/m.77996 type:complete len:256 (-) Transcript_26161:390-1157(-)